MAIELDLKQHIHKYGIHELKVIATGEGFRNSEPVIVSIDFKPVIYYKETNILVKNIQPDVSQFRLYVDGSYVKTIEHDISLTEDVLIPIDDISINLEELHSFYVIATTSYGEFTSDQVKTTKVFGVSGMYDPSLILTRTDDSVGMTYNVNTSTGEITSDFDNEFPYKEIKEVIVDDNVFISIPEMWWRIGKDEENNITDIAVAKYPIGGGNWYKSDAFYVGKYMSFQEGGKMVSKSGKGMNYSYSAVQWTNYATANGDGYKPIGMYEYTILNFLWLIEFANKKSTNIVNGYNSYNLATGGTDSIEFNTGFLTSNKRMKYRGIEDFFGNDIYWLPDVTGNYYTSRDVSTYVAGTVGKKQLCYYQNITASSSWRTIYALGWDDEAPFICLPSKVGNSNQNTYFGTNMYGPNNSPNYCARGKFYSGYSTNCNLMTIIFEYSFTSTSDTMSSRLIKYNN